jgi:hypothetical protein
LLFSARNGVLLLGFGENRGFLLKETMVGLQAYGVCKDLQEMVYIMGSSPRPVQAELVESGTPEGMEMKKNQIYKELQSVGILWVEVVFPLKGGVGSWVYRPPLLVSSLEVRDCHIGLQGNNQEEETRRRDCAGSGNGR